MWKSTLLKTIQKIAMPFKQKNNVISFVMPFVGPHIRSSIIFRSSHPTAQPYTTRIAVELHALSEIVYGEQENSL